MGEGTKRSNAKTYRQQLAKVGSEGAFGGSVLGALPVDEEILLSCNSIPTAVAPSVHEKVDLIDRGQSAVEVFHNAQKIGHVGSSGTTILRLEIKIGDIPSKHMSAIVIKQNAALGTFVVRLSNY